MDLYNEGNFTGAITLFEESVDLVEGTDQAPILNNIGACYVALDEPEEALIYYNKAIEADPAYGRGWINHGIVSEHLESNDQALSDYEKAAEVDSSVLTEAMIKKGKLLIRMSRFDEALNTYQSVENMVEGVEAGELHTDIGAVYYLQDNVDQAKKYFEQAITEDPEGAAIAYTNLGVIYISEEEYEKAIEAFEIAKSIDSTGDTEAAEYLDKLNQMLEDMNREA